MPKLIPSNTMIVFALEIEAQGRFDDFQPLFTGVGKVNAAYRFARAITEWRYRNGNSPCQVLNLGSAGSTQFSKGSLVNCTQFVQRDFDVTALGVAPHTTPFEDVPTYLSNGMRYLKYPEGICGTGDSFATDGAMAAWNVIDMEAYALAKICHFEKVPFGCLKYITDGADGEAAQSWEGQLSEVSQKLHAAVLVLANN